MKIGLVGPSYLQRSRIFDAQRTINLIPILDEQGKEVVSLLGTPGLSLFGSAGTGPIRGCFASSNGRSFVVSAGTLYEMSSSGVATIRGTLNTSSGNISIDENPTQLFICDGTDGYVFTYSSNSFVEVTDTDFPTAGTVTYIDGYFVVNSVGTGRFFISSTNDGTAWDALDFSNAESNPDQLLRVFRGLGQLWLFGENTSEVWTNTGDSAFPFQKIAGAEMDVGIMAPHSVVSVGSSLYWIGKNSEGTAVVYRANGFTPEPISTEAISIFIQNATDKDNIRGFSYQQDGHTYYVLTGGGLATSLVFDLNTRLWHERSYLNLDGEHEQHLASCCMFAFGKHLVGDRRNGNVYILDLSAYSDNGNEIARDRIYTHISNEGERIRYNSLEIGFEVGVGLQSGQGSDPKALLKISKDGTQTWSNWHELSIGAVGQYNTKVCFRRIGIAEILTFWLRVSDPVKVSIVGSYLK